MTVRRSLSTLALRCAALTCCSIIAVSSGSADDAAEYTLKYKFRANEFVRYKATHRTVITTQYAKQNDVTRNETSMRKHVRVTSLAEDGSAVLEPVIDQVEMTVQFGDQEPVQFDSRWSAERIPARFKDVQRTIGKPQARVRVRPSGEFVNQDEAADDPTRNFLVTFPTKPVKVGETWTDDFVVSVAINKEISRTVKLLRSYRLEKIEGSVAVISAVTSVVDPIRKPEIKAQLIQREPSGEIRFDMDRGLIVSRTLKIDKTVFNCLGPNTSMRAETFKSEELLPSDVAQVQK